MTEPVRFSHLKRMAESPAHYRASVERAWSPSLSMRLGTIVDRAIFGGNLPVYEGTRRGKAWDAFVAERGDPDEIVTASEVAEAQPMIRALRANPEAMRLLTDGDAQQVIRWQYRGVECQSTPDVIKRSERRVVDLKTARTSNPHRFSRDALRYCYHAQLAFYGEAIGLDPADDHYIVCVESQAPHCVTILRLTERAVIAGRKLCALWMERLQACRAANEWPGYVQSVVELDVPDELELDFGDTAEQEGE